MVCSISKKLINKVNMMEKSFIQPTSSGAQIFGRQGNEIQTTLNAMVDRMGNISGYW